METRCEITVEIGGHKKTREKEIKRVCMVEWAFRDDDFFHVLAGRSRKKLLQASALGVLYGDDDAQDVIARIERAIWRANDGMCHVQATARCLNGCGLFEGTDADNSELVAV